MKRFLAAAAMAPLCFAAMDARAQTTIAESITTPVRTSTTGDLNISNAGKVAVSDGAAVTVDSANSVSNTGTIEVSNAPGEATAIRVESASGRVDFSGVINVGDSDEATDTDQDGDLDGPFVTQTPARFGVHVINDFTGDVTQNATALTQVKGNNSAAVALDGVLTGKFANDGQIVMLGDDSFGLHASRRIAGDVALGGAIVVQGENTVGAAFDEGVTGKFVIDGQILTTGFRYRQRPDQAGLDILDADDLLIGGPALRLRGAFAQGVLIDAPPPDLVPEDADEDDDGVDDALETTGVIVSLGSAPAILVGGAGATTLSNVDGATTGHGLIVRGAVQVNALFNNIPVNGIQIGGTGAAGETVDLGGGLRVTGTMTGVSYDADATAIRVGAGATVPEVRLQGSLNYNINLVDGTAAPTIRGVAIEPGGSVSRLVNTGLFNTAIVGPRGDAIGVSDQAGSLREIFNFGTLQAGLASSETITGKSIAFDLRANTSGVTISQELFAGREQTPLISGDILLGSGDDSVQVRSGSIFGALDFAGGSNSLLIDGGAYSGALANPTGVLDLNVANGRMLNTAASTVNVDELAVGGAGVLIFSANPAATDPNQRITRYLANTASLADGAQIDLNLQSKLTTGAVYELIRTNAPGQLSIAGLDTSLLGDLPFFYKASLATTTQSVTLDVQRRSAVEAGLSGARAAAFDSIFESFDRDSGLNTSLLSKTNETGFAELYDQLLPDYSGGAFQSLAAGARAVMRTPAEEPSTMTAGQSRSWLQEIGFTATHTGGTTGEVGYRDNGFGVAGGIETADRGKGAIGLAAAFISSSVDNENRRGESLMTASALLGSLYWRKRDGGLTLDANATAGYAWFDSDRNILDLDPFGVRLLVRQVGGEWKGGMLSGRVGAAYETTAGPFYIRPEAFADYVYLWEGGYTETGGGAGVNLDVDSRSSYEAGAEVGVTVGAWMGRGFRWSPEMRVAYRYVVASGLSETTARFASIPGATPFTMRSLGLDDGRLVIRATLRGAGPYTNLAFETSGEFGDVYEAYQARLIVRFLF